ncbi:MAG: NusA-like transcription termination signal-binding factor [Candidatus Aenigmarchaeota archaeon]|nr:NusA-like transcription termination signal-binding factor [Candidatus Aenigmarchaeota archaeon]OYT42757.1 MAG: transcription elongation factor NusA [Candidatus Aenigmarchaeota archaeon ex4484_56]
MARDFTTETMRLLTLFENITNVPVRDCFLDNGVVYYIVEENKARLAIGKDGVSIKNAEKIIGKKIKIYEYSPDLEKFVKNLIPQTKEIKIIKNDENIVQIKVSKNDKGFVIGRGGEKIKIYKEILKRIHNVVDLQVK